MKIIEMSREIRQRLSDAGIIESDNETRVILREIAGIFSSELFSDPDRQVEPEIYGRVMECVDRRISREPLQYILGTWSFMGLDFAVAPGVLIPRPDTEVLVETALKDLHDGMTVLDMCTGTGCILISLLHYSNDCEGTAVDISDTALEMAKINAGRILGENCIVDGSFRLIKSDLFESVEGKYDIIVSNPPYIETDVIDTLEPEVKDHEPHLALDGGNDGLDLVRKIIGNSGEHLTGGGVLIMEIGSDQGERCVRLMEEAGYVNVECIKDYAGLDRVVRGVKSHNLRTAMDNMNQITA